MGAFASLKNNMATFFVNKMLVPVLGNVNIFWAYFIKREYLRKLLLLFFLHIKYKTKVKDKF